jgi:hypothetical protein
MTLGLPERIESKISPEPNSGCWLWMAGLRDSPRAGNGGYGGVRWRGAVWRTHVLVYTLLKGPVPQGHVLDHTCRVRVCCNPDHLEPVTQLTNVHRGEGVAKYTALQTHCVRGHEFTILKSGYRRCRTCHLANCKLAYRKRVEHRDV